MYGRTIDGEEAGALDYSFAILGAIIPAVNGAELRSVGKLAKISKKLDNAAFKIKNILDKSKDLRNSFENGKYSIVEATEDITVYRVSGGSSKKGRGSFFTTIKPETSAQAEELLNINKFGNTGVEVTPVTIKKGTQFATGNVAEGTGVQIFIPEDLQKAESNNIIRHYSKTETLK